MPVSQIDSTTLRRHNVSVKLILSYVLDWIVLVAVGIVSYIIDNLEPHKRPFSLTDPNISLPYREAETVPLWLLGVFIAALPFLVILIVTFVFVPGATTPRLTPAALIWRRKLWEFHAGVLGLATANIIAFFFTQGMKNLFGKPRPDLLDRCQPDVDNAGLHAVGEFVGQSLAGQLYSASICQQEDSHILDDGFRSYPSGHSSAAAAGLVYLSLFLASKFAVGIPFWAGASSKAVSHAAFPSRMVIADPLHDRLKDSGSPFAVTSKSVYGHHNQNSAKLRSPRNQAAGPPLYLLAIVLAPFSLSIYISASRWFDFRHHGFDILFGYLIGLISAVYSFRCYHLPISEGAGWAWGPRSNDRAFWAGVGMMGYTSQPIEEAISTADAEKGHGMRSNEVDCRDEVVSAQPSVSQIPTNASDGHGPGPLNSQPYNANPSNSYAPSGSHQPYDGSGSRYDYLDVEMQRMDNRS